MKTYILRDENLSHYNKSKQNHVNFVFQGSPRDNFVINLMCYQLKKKQESISVSFITVINIKSAIENLVFEKFSSIKMP
jgi:hypothetical protein